MARIRTIKPDFFTSEDIVSLSPLARLLYIATWCEADKEGRLLWKPRTFKLRYFPADDCDIDALARELVASGLVIPYGEGLAYIPSFPKHQHINPRESKSELPAPPTSRDRHASARVDDASARDSDAQGGREGKEYICDASPTRGRFAPPTPTEVTDYARSIGSSVDGSRFVDFYASKGWKVGKSPMKDWRAAVRNWSKSDTPKSDKHWSTEGLVL